MSAITLLPAAAPAPSAQGSDNPLDDGKLGKRLLKQTSQAIADFGLIEPGDKVMVCVSGGKDSYGMLDMLLRYQRLHGTPPFELVAVNLDQKQPGFPAHVLPEFLTRLGVPFHIETKDTYSVVKQQMPEGSTMCSLCSRLRRGILHRVATELGCNKIALGHHRDDMLHTFLLNFFFAGKLQAMPPKGVSQNSAGEKGNHTVIRPLAYVAEAELARWADLQAFPIIPCTLCGSQDNLQRQQMRQLVAEWQTQHPGRLASMVTALKHVVPSHLMDPKAFDFKGLEATALPVVTLD
ncbi:MAG: tRNA 2-thiocytidine(32) synthetase TtcA [Burkholderiaceae bacterium]|nr:tRNA 2-thiocytidine(32) synthetase TtcA [Burkholderiaceae bacterium]